MDMTSRQWVLDHHPDGMPDESCWRMEEARLPDLKDGEILARSIYLSVDPYMRGRISKQANYAAGVGIGDVMHGGAVAEVVESRHPDWKKGDLLETIHFGWQSHAVLKGDGLTRVDPSLGPIHAYLSYLGMPGITAWCAMDMIGKVKEGETVLVSAASGAVGQVVGQITKIKGGRAVAVASSQEKLDWCGELGYDAGVNYREAADQAALDKAIADACPDGVDVYFDNTAGPIHDAAMHNLNIGGRVIICGTISLAGKFEEPDIGERHIRKLLTARAIMQGFLVFDHLERYDEARAELAQWKRDGKLRFKTDIANGLAEMPRAFLNLLHSRNFGKQVVRVAEDPARH